MGSSRSYTQEVRFTASQQETVVRALRLLGDEGDKLANRLARIKEGPTASMKAINAASQELRGSLYNLSSGAGGLGNVLASIGPKGLAAAAAIGAVALAVKRGIASYGEEERAQLRLQSVLRATGNAAGLTAAQIGELGDTLERTTFFKKEDILAAAAALNTFKAVSGEAFERTIRLAADMSETFGGDLAGNARLLGKALQDPAEGLSALKRIAGEMSPEVEKAAIAFERTGQHGKAVSVILDELEGRMGGSAVAAAQGMAGAADNLSDSFDDLLKSIGHLANESGLVSYLNLLAAGLDGLANGFASLNKSMAENVHQRKLMLEGSDLATLSSPEEYNKKAKANGFVTEATKVSGYSIKDGSLVAPAPTLTPQQIRDREEAQKKAEKAAHDALEKRLNLQRQIGDLEDEHAAFVRGGDKEAEIQNKLNAFLRDTKGLRADEVEVLKQKYEQQLRIQQADKDQVEYQRELQKQAEKAAEEMAKPVEHAYERMQDAAADMLADGEFKARDFVGIWKRAAAEIAAALIFRPVLASTIGSILPGMSGGISGGVPGMSGSVTGGGMGGFSALSGLSSIGSGLMSGFSTPLINPGIAFDIGSKLGLSAGSVGFLHSGLANFTPMAGLASIGGGLLSNALFKGKGYSNIGSTIGGLAGTFFGGPIGGFLGSVAGGALGSVFGKKKAPPVASFEGNLSPSGALDMSYVYAKNMSQDVPQGVADQLSQFLQGLTGLSGAQFNPEKINARFGGGRGALLIGSAFSSEFNPGDAESMARAFHDLATHLAKSADTVNNDLVKALANVNTEGKDAAGVLSAVGNSLSFIKGLREFSDSLLSDPTTSNLSPEEMRKNAQIKFSDITAGAATGKYSADDVKSAALALLQASQGYAGKASDIYAGDLDAVRQQLAYLSDNPPRFATGGDFSKGPFIVHPNEIIMTSSTPGKVLSASETRQALNGGTQDSLMLYRALSSMKGMIGEMVDELRITNRNLTRATSQ